MANVLLVHGTEHFLCRRTVKEAVRHYTQEKDFRLVRLSGSDKNSLSTTLSGSGLFVQDSLVVVDEKISDLDLGLVEKQIKEPNPSVVLLIHHEGTLRKNSKLRKLIPAKSQMIHDAPPFYKAEEFAIGFCVAEAKRHKKKLKKSLAKALVVRAGTDLGLLSFEVQKLCKCADSEGVKDITSAHLAGTIASLVELSVMQLVDAIADQNAKKTMVALSRVRRTHASDPTIKCCRILGSSLMKWAAAWALDTSKIGANVAAKHMKANSWYYSNKLLPPAKRWGKQGLSQLLHVVADAERNVKEGVLDPWSGFVALLIRAFPAKTLSR